MPRISVATGCFYQLGMSMEERIAAVDDVDADGIEITLGTAEDAYDLNIDAVAAQLDGFTFRSIHAPIRESFRDDRASRRLLDRLEEIRAGIDASVVVFHPDRLSRLKLVEDMTRPAIENMQRRKGFDRDDLAAFLTDADTPVVVDTCHAATWGDDELPYLLETYTERISHVHLSAYDPVEDVEHALLAEQRDTFLEERLAQRLEDHMLVLENRLERIEDLEREMRFVRDIFR